VQDYGTVQYMTVLYFPLSVPLVQLAPPAHAPRHAGHRPLFRAQGGGQAPLPAGTSDAAQAKRQQLVRAQVPQLCRTVLSFIVVETVPSLITREARLGAWREETVPSLLSCAAPHTPLCAVSHTPLCAVASKPLFAVPHTPPLCCALRPSLVLCLTPPLVLMPPTPLCAVASKPLFAVPHTPLCAVPCDPLLCYASHLPLFYATHPPLCRGLQAPLCCASHPPLCCALRPSLVLCLTPPLVLCHPPPSVPWPVSLCAAAALHRPAAAVGTPFGLRTLTGPCW